MNIREIRINSSLKKVITGLIMAAVAVMIMYVVSCIRLPQLWDNERLAMVFTSSVMYILYSIYLLIKENDIKKILIIYLSAAAGMAVMMFIPYEYRPCVLIFMITAYLFGVEHGVVLTLVSALAYAYLLDMDDKYLYGMVIIGITGVIAAKKITNRINLFVYMIVFAVCAFVVNGMLDYYYLGEFDLKTAYMANTSVIISMIAFVNIYIFTGDKSVKPFLSENSWMAEIIKEKSISLYYHSVEIAELAKKGADKADIDKDICYAAGICYELGRLEESDDSVKMGIKLCAKYDLPKSIKSIIIEHGAKYRKPTTKESAVVLLAESVVTSIEYLRTREKEVSEEKIIENVFNIRMNKGVLSNSKMTLDEYIKVKKGFIEYFGGKNEHLD